MKTPETFGELFDVIEASVRAKALGAGSAAPTFGRSEAEAHEYKALGNIATYPVSGQAKRASDRGGRRHTGTGTETEAVSDPSPLWDRGVLFAARVYQKDIDTCNELAGHLVAALEDTLGGTNHEVTGEEWDTTGKVARGMVLVVTFRINARWYTSPTPTVVPTSYEQTTELQAPS